RLGDSQPLLHSLRHRLDRAPARLLQPDQLEQLDALALTTPRAGETLVQLEKLVRRHPPGKAEQLREGAHRRARLSRACARTANLRASRCRANEAAGDLHERRLAGAVRAQQSDELALADFEVDTDECVDGAVALHETADGERGGDGAERTLHLMPPGYQDGPVAEEAQARLDALERGEPIEPAPHAPDRRA